ncbi:hypothetical protein RCG28_10625 [Lactococcus lactis]|uniref:hypothetical protein n=1 Tax=Lactococcus lactis TaxID=1358 RepID=UPI00280B8F1D|nr:hypothetical protein [Lactococcus lactis]WMM01588.1 hypothetical protein RCG57_10625 [Lactococcus lactis]WMM08267.1 hypothetical protein RCG28_10625 [Lactococcus lactis]
MQVNFLIIIAQKERNSMAIRYYWGRPKDVIRWYLRGTLYLSAQSRKSYIEKIGAAPGNLTRLLKLLDNLDEIFDPVDTDSIALLCLRYVELLSVAETTKRTGLSAYQITSKIGKLMKEAKEIIAKA